MLSASELAELEAYLPHANEDERRKINEYLVSIRKVENNFPWAAYRYDPIGYAYNVLGLTFLSDDQKIALRAAVTPPYRVQIDAGNAVGKSLTCAVLASWFYDSYDPGCVFTTAPTHDHVVRVLWAQIRSLRSNAKMKLPMDFIGPAAPEMRSSEYHFAKGLTASKGEALKGSHLQNMCFIFDESEALPVMYWESVRTMFKPQPGMLWLSVGNPTTTSSAAFLESTRTDENKKPFWRNLRMSVLNHPNIIAGLQGLPPPIPNAVDVGMVDDWVRRLCTPLDEKEEKKATDFQWRGRWYRPSGEAETVILGCRPSTGASGVWSDSLWEACCHLDLPFPIDQPPELGCDVARVLGGDDCDIHAQWGGNSLAHDSANGRSIPATIARLKEMAEEVCEFANAKRKELVATGKYSPEELSRAQIHKPWVPKEIPVKIDDCGIGNVITDFADGWNFIPVNPGWAAKQDLRYPNVRSELWFETQEKAILFGLSMKHLSEDDQQMLRIQSFAPKWELDARRRRVVESKEDTKKRLGRSPDGMDAFNLAHFHANFGVASLAGIETGVSRTDQTMGARIGIGGRGQRGSPASVPDEPPRRDENKVTLWGRRK